MYRASFDYGGSTTATVHVLVGGARKWRRQPESKDPRWLSARCGPVVVAVRLDVHQSIDRAKPPRYKAESLSPSIN